MEYLRKDKVRRVGGSPRQGLRVLGARKLEIKIRIPAFRDPEGTEAKFCAFILSRG